MERVRVESSSSAELLDALAATTSGLGFLLPAANGRLHVVPAPLELTKNALGGHLPLEMLDGTLEALFSDGDLDLLALNRFANGHGGRVVTRPHAGCKRIRRDTGLRHLRDRTMSRASSPADGGSFELRSGWRAST